MNKYKLSNKILVNIIGIISFLSIVAYFILYYESESIKLSNNQNNTIIIKGNVKHFEGALLANAANETHDIQLAEELYKIALNKVKADKKWEVYYNMGCTYIEHKEHQKAINALEKAIKLNPKCDACYERRGSAYQFLKNPNQALLDFNKSISIKPTVYAYNNRSAIYNRYLNQIDKAIDDLKMASKLDSKILDPYINLFILYFDNNNPKEANKCINKFHENINENNFINYSTYLLLKAALNLLEENIDEFLKNIKIVFKRNSEIVQKHNITLRYDILRVTFIYSIRNYLMRHEHSSALKVIHYAIESAEINNDSMFVNKLKKDLQYINALKNNYDKNYKYSYGSLEIDS